MRFKKQVALLLGVSSLIPAAIAARPHAAYAATVANTYVAKSCKVSVPLSAAQMRLTKAGDDIDAICYVIAICTGFWPIGTIACGPTAIGCAVYYAKK
jgi:hypothetical protein